MASLKRRFDWDSGQVYHETTVKSSLDLTWLEGPRLSQQVRVLSPTTPTLLQSATRTLLHNLNRLPADSLRSVPWHLVADVWRRAQERELDHFKCWRAFATSFPERECFQWRPVDIPNPSGPLDSYLVHLNSPSARWLTCLSISTKYVTKPDLVRLPNILDNLVSLEIIPPTGNETNYSCTIDDRLIKAWSPLGIEDGQRRQFSKLRVLVLRQPHGLTPASMSHLGAFPKLSIFIAQLSKEDTARFEPIASSHGWLVNPPEELRYAKVADDLEWRRFSHAYAMLILQRQVPEAEEKNDETPTTANIPCVDFSFGRPWGNRGLSNHHYSRTPDTPYPKPHIRGLKTVCFVRIGGATPRASLAPAKPIKSTSQAPPKRIRIRQGQDLESMLSSFTKPARSTARRGQKHG